MTIEKFIPEPQDKCQSCKRKEVPDEFVDLVGLHIGSLDLVLCNSCCLALFRLLYNRYYPVWGRQKGTVFDLFCDSEVVTEITLP